jgi:4-amino-4-deoxy-L-arabinose transferase-like glycosyltransferase
MTNPAQRSISRSTSRRTAFVLALFCMLTTIAMQSARAQTFQVLHTFVVRAAVWCGRSRHN